MTEKFTIIASDYSVAENCPVVRIAEWPRPLYIRTAHLLTVMTVQGQIALALAEAQRRERERDFPANRHEKYRALLDRP